MDLEEYLGQFRVKAPAPQLKDRVLPPLNATRALPTHRRRMWLSAAAAILLCIGIGSWLWLNSDGTFRPVSVQPIEIFAGRGRLVPLDNATRFTLVDAARGHFRLERGQVYVELDDGSGLQAKVETTAGTATTVGSRFLAHCSGSAADAFLAVAILHGVALVNNVHGQSLAETGDMILAETNAAPEKHSGAAGVPRFHGQCPFINASSLIFRPAIQSDLKLTEDQKARLQPDDDIRELCRFFRSVQELPASERNTRIADFGARQQQKLTNILTASQQQRLQEIRLQYEGFLAAARPDVASRLKLKHEQTQQVKNILDEFTKAHRVALPLSPGTAVGEHLEQLRQRVASDIGVLLTAEQRKAFEEIQGLPFVCKH